jgi:hypothetical protein
MPKRGNTPQGHMKNLMNKLPVEEQQSYARGQTPVKK